MDALHSMLGHVARKFSTGDINSNGEAVVVPPYTTVEAIIGAMGRAFVDLGSIGKFKLCCSFCCKD
jgi:hypothetical protein